MSKTLRHFSHPFALPAYNLSPRKVTKLLLSIVALLLLFNILESGLISWLNENYDLQSRFDIETFPQFFNFDHEANFPSIYSALSLGFCGYLLSMIAAFKRTERAAYARHWKWLSIIFFALAVDEACSIHEISIPLLRTVIKSEGFLYFPWILPASILVFIFLLVFRKFIFSLPLRTKALFILAGAIYVGGAIGMESIGGYIADTPGLHPAAYSVAATIEELLEMLGVIIFIYALLSYIKSQLCDLSITYSFQEKAKRRSHQASSDLV